MEIEFFVDSLSVLGLGLGLLSSGEYTGVCISILQTDSINLAAGTAAGILIDVTDKELAFKKGWHVYMMLTNSIPTPLNYFIV